MSEKIYFHLTKDLQRQIARCGLTDQFCHYATLSTSTIAGTFSSTSTIEMHKNAPPSCAQCPTARKTTQ